MTRDRPSTIVVCGDAIVRWDVLSTAIKETYKLDLARSQDPGAPPHMLQVGSSYRTGDLLPVLSWTRPSISTDPRDKFFASLPLVHEDVGSLASYR